MRAMKFNIGNDPVLSDRVQRVLFDLGYGWYYNGKSVQYTEKPYLFADKDGYIVCANYLRTSLEETDHEEINIDWMRSVEPEIVELNGKKYLKSELEAALSHIKPVEE